MDWTFLPWIEFISLHWINVEKMWSRSWNRHFLPGAGAVNTFYLKPEPESEPKCFPRAGAGAGDAKNFHGSASLINRDANYMHVTCTCSVHPRSAFSTVPPYPYHILPIYRVWYPILALCKKSS